MKKKVLVFDFDGVIVDSKEFYIDAFYYTFLKTPYRLSRKKISEALGPTVKVVIKNFKIKKKDLFLLEDVKKYVVARANTLKPCPYAKGIIKKLSKNYKLVIITNSPTLYIVKALKKYNLLKYFSDLYCERFNTKEEAFRHVFKKYKVKAKDVYYIADMKKDVEIARNVGCITLVPLICSWNKKQLKGKRFTYKNLKELSRLLE